MFGAGDQGNRISAEEEVVRILGMEAYWFCRGYGQQSGEERRGSKRPGYYHG
jgi:hypothetical protein